MAELNGSSAKETLNQIPFFVNQEVDKRLFSMYMEENDEESNDLNLYIQEGDDFSIDIIEQPFHLEYKGLNNGICINLFLRDGYGIYNEEDADYSALIDANGVEQSAVKRGRIGGDLSAACIRYLKSGSQLKKYVLEQGLLNSFSGLDKEKEGVLVTLQEDTLVFQRVTGKRRPSMFCTSLFGGARMDRPYLDERASALASELFHNDLSFDNLMELAEDGDVDAMGKVAIAFLNGDEDAGVEPDAEKAVFWFRKQAEADDPTGCFNLAIQYLKGEGVEQDFDQALSWMKKAEENGDSDAVEYIPMLEKLSALKAKADQDDTGAMAELASQLMSVGKSVGDPTEKEFYAKSVELAQKADATNEPEACWVLALAYEHGRGVIENTEKALEYYQKGAELGNPDCQLNLGLCYIEGKKVPEDKVKGFEFCLKAAEQGHGGAMKAVGSCYQFENGVQYDMKKAIYWYEKALEVIDDPELAKKVMIFKTLEDIDDEMDDNGDIDHIPAEDIDKVNEISEESNEDMTEFHKNYTSDLREGEDGAIEEEEIDTSGLPDGYIEAMDMVLMAAEISEKELDSFENESCEADFRIVISKAESGDAEAKFTAGKYFIANHIEEETERAIRWIREAAEAGVDKTEEYIKEHNELFGNAFSQCENPLTETTKSVSDTESELSSLGSFAFGRKRGQMFDQRMSFNLPRKWEFIEGTDDDGNKSYKICYNITINSDGEKQAEESYSVMKRQKKNSLVSNVEGNIPVQVSGFTKDFSIGLRVESSGGRSSSSEINYKIYTGLAVVEYADQFYIVIAFNLGQDDYKSRSEAAEKLASGLTKVLGFIVFDGELLKIKPIPKSLILDELKKEGFDLKTIEETPEEKAARLEREKKEREIQLEKERKEREAREKALAEKRKAEEVRRRREEEEQKKREEESRKAAEAAKEKLEAEQKVWEEEASRIQTVREEELAKRLFNIEKIRTKVLAELEAEKDSTLSLCKKALAETIEEVTDMEAELSALGFFAFGRKGELKKSIEAGKQKIQNLASQKDSIIKTYEEKVAAANNKADTDSKSTKSEIEKEYPIQDSPAEKERKKKEEEARLKAEAEAKAKAEAERKAQEEAVRKEKSELEKVFRKWGSNKKNYLAVLQFLRVHPGTYDGHLWNFIPQYIDKDSCPIWEVMDALKKERLVEKRTVTTTNIYGHVYTIGLPFVTKTGEQFIEKYEKLWGKLEDEYPDPTNLLDSKILILAQDIMQREDGATMDKLLEDPILNKVGSARLTRIFRDKTNKKFLKYKNGEYFG